MSKQNTTKQAHRADWWLPKAGGGMGDMGEGDQKVQTSKHKIHVLGRVMYTVATIVNKTALPI